MTPVPSPAVSRRRRNGAAARRNGGSRRRDDIGQAWVAAVPAVLTLGVTLYHIQRPSYWGDEAATLSAVRRSLPQLARLLGHTDAVHGAYYVIMWFWVRLAGGGSFSGSTELLVRFPSAVAMAATAGGVTLLGRRLVSSRAGLMAGLVFAALPEVSWYGQDARSYALVTAVATAATYFFVRAMDGSGRARRRWLVAYGCALALLGLSNLFALLLIGAHAVTLVVRLRHRRWSDGAPAPEAGTGADPPEGRPLVSGWLAAVAAAVAVTSPVAVFGWLERRQIHWIKKPSLATAIHAQVIIGPHPLVVAVLVVTAAAVAVGALAGGARLRADWPTRLTALAIPWLILPAAVLLTVSQAIPVYQSRYIIFCLPAAALLAGAGLAGLGRVAGAAALILVMLMAVPAQVRAREPSGHGQNLRKVSQLLASHAQRGDAVLFANHWLQEIERAYPDGFRSLRDVSLGETATQVGLLTGTTAPEPVILARLATVDRLWVIQNVRMPLPSFAQQGFTLVGTWRSSIFRLEFFRRGPAGAGSSR